MMKKLTTASVLICSLFIAIAFRDGKADTQCGGFGQKPCSLCEEPVSRSEPFGFCCLPAQSTCERQTLKCSDGFFLNGTGFCTKTRVTVQEAIEAGCRSEADVKETLSSLVEQTSHDSITRRKVAEFPARGNWATKLNVNASDTWGYRATTIPKEVEFLEKGRTYSKAQRRIAKRPNNEDHFWAMNGPKVDLTSPGQPGLGLQMLATQSSDTPASQFSSVALSPEVAAGFGPIVYKFQLSPGSPILGLEDCALDNPTEIQFQVPHNTEIQNLHRRNSTGGAWERYVNGSWIPEGGHDEL